MENPSHSDGTVSLHLYVPPYSECQTFDQRTGVKTKATVTFYTKYGKKMDYKGSKKGKLVDGPTKEHLRLAAIRNTAMVGDSGKALTEKG